MSVSALDFGPTHAGPPAHLYRLTNAHGMEVDVTDLGASLVAVRVPAADGTLVDVALGYDEVSGYEHNKYALGGTVGRCANRIANASFELDGRTYALTANEGTTTLHGGCDMWFERLWEGAIVGRKGDRRRGSHANTVILGLFSPDGDQGFPGDLDVRVTYRLTDDNELKITYDAQPSIPTLVNLTNHVYWNLNGHDAEDVLDLDLQVYAEKYTPTGGTKIPTGIAVNVGGTPFDFRLAKPVGRDIAANQSGYDTNYLLDTKHRMHKAATLTSSRTGITMDVYTDMPALQVFTSRHFNAQGGKDGVEYGAFAGVALETQFVPDAIHHDAFRDPVFTPDEPLHSSTTYVFGNVE